MTKRKKVSLILTTYNCRENLIRTLDSIARQDYPDLEIVIVDGGSTDGTVDVIKEFAAGHSRRNTLQVKWISEKDNGIYDAMNKGYRRSEGDIVAFFNDFFLMDNAVSLMVNAIEDGDYDGAHADLIYATDEKVKRYWKMGRGKIENGWMPGHPTLYLKREVYEKYGIYNPDYKCSADYEFMIRILRDHTVRLAYVPKTILRMYYGGTSTQGAGSYFLSLKEAHRALKENRVPFAFKIDILRTCRVFAQFAGAGGYKGSIN